MKTLPGHADSAADKGEDNAVEVFVSQLFLHVFSLVFVAAIEYSVHVRGSPKASKSSPLNINTRHRTHTFT